MIIEWIQQKLPTSNMTCLVLGAVLCCCFILGLMIIVKLFEYFVLKKGAKAPGIKVFGEHGDIFIASVAIHDLVEHVLGDFTFINASKISLFRQEQDYILNIDIVFDAQSGESLPTITGSIRSNILSALDRTFGVRNVKTINMHLRRAVLSS